MTSFYPFLSYEGYFNFATIDYVVKRRLNLGQCTFQFGHNSSKIFHFLWHIVRISSPETCQRGVLLLRRLVKSLTQWIL